MSTAGDLKKKGMELYRAGRFEDAMTAFAHAQEAFLAQGNLQHAAETANDWGVAARQAAHFDEAEAAFAKASKLFDELGDRLSQGQVLGNLGALSESRNQNKQAAAFYTQAIVLFDKVGAADLSAQTWRALSRLRMKQGKWFAALGAYDAGLQDTQHLTPTQRLLRRLIRVAQRLMSGG